MSSDGPPTQHPDTSDGAENAADGSERRSAARHPISLRVDYKRMNAFFADYAKNISRGGTFIRTSKPLPVGTEFVFVLSIPEQAKPLQLLGEVMWSVDEGRATEEQPAGMGIRFRLADGAEREQLETFVTRLMNEKLGTYVASRLLKR